MDPKANECQERIDQLLNLPRQIWLLGAGASKDAGLPLMQPLTDRVGALLAEKNESLSRDYEALRAQLRDGANVEDVLSQVADLIALAKRTRDQKGQVGDDQRSLDELRSLHASVQEAIRYTMRWGYRPAQDGHQEAVGRPEDPIVDVSKHVAFVEALLGTRRAGLEAKRPPVALFTTNYDTLLEDALALSRVVYCDGFAGGAMASWHPSWPSQTFQRPLLAAGGYEAKFYKLHGSIDWWVAKDGTVTRRREGAGYPKDEADRLLIYPQATKYLAAQRDPFATLFGAFRAALTEQGDRLLVVCGSSFSDDHINTEIEQALTHPDSRDLTVLAFVNQGDAASAEQGGGIPPALAGWLSGGSEAWRERLVVAGSRGVYSGALANQCPTPAHKPHSWSTFAGLTNLLLRGPEVGP